MDARQIAKFLDDAMSLVEKLTEEEEEVLIKACIEVALAEKEVKVLRQHPLMSQRSVSDVPLS
ncbi:hypothetical protein SLH49_19930 [Cognatiyoonia sp. IB215446]|uniref:hypothetical protein n=1 Tax=Cognatiyoonia sp. IB215446 TaxID=3097355 RepID=UPI002A111F7F|nr:hypothetical protein [Cognatiyoonia sp. IB215446]MDX8350268.1 hypothetical protein [Cognatiyoonia sp. IB215446]